MSESTGCSRSKKSEMARNKKVGTIADAAEGKAKANKSNAERSQTDFDAREGRIDGKRNGNGI
jgi:hypothetical protein